MERMLDFILENSDSAKDLGVSLVEEIYPF